MRKSPGLDPTPPAVEPIDATLYRRPGASISTRVGVRSPLSARAIARAVARRRSRPRGTSRRVGHGRADRRRRAHRAEPRAHGRRRSDGRPFVSDARARGTFPSGGSRPERASRLRAHIGDIAISVERAVEQAEQGRGGQTGDIRWSAADEIRLLVTHGTLHLCGWDHAEPGDEAAMRAKERELLEAARP